MYNAFVFAHFRVVQMWICCGESKRVQQAEVQVRLQVLLRVPIGERSVRAHSQVARLHRQCHW